MGPLKILLSLFIFLPMITFANQEFNLEELKWADLGSAVVNNNIEIINCVIGNKITFEMEKPQIIYRLRAEKKPNNNSSSSKLVAEMLVIDKVKKLTNVVSNKSYYLSKQNCGENYISEFQYGARIAYTFFIENEEAEQIKSFEMIEVDTSRATEFYNQAMGIISNLKTMSGFGWEMIGSLNIPNGTMNETFELYKVKALADKTLRNAMKAMSSSYPDSVRKDFRN